MSQRQRGGHLISSPLKRQLRASTLDRIDEGLATGSDPLLDAWITPEAAAGTVLGGKSHD